MKMDFPEEYPAFAELYCHTMTPVLLEFTIWTLQQAMNDGKQVLYYLARDGYLEYRIAKKIANAYQLPLDIRYLKVSRYSLRMAEYYISDHPLDTICTGGIDITLEKVLRRGGLTEEEILQISREIPLRFHGKCLNYVLIRELKRILSMNDAFLGFVYKHAKEHYENTLQYLRQEGIRPGVSYAVVDSGWIGTIQQSLENLSGVPTDGYYFGLYEIPQNADRDRYHGFYFMPGTHLYRKVTFSNCLYEVLASSPDGMTINYSCRKGEMEDNNAIYDAVESEYKNPNAPYMKVACEVCETYAAFYLGEMNKTEKHEGRQHKVRIDLAKLLKLFMAYPEQEEVNLFGNLLFCDDVLEHRFCPVAALWDEKECRKQRFMVKMLAGIGMRKEEFHDSAWPEGSIVRLHSFHYLRLRSEQRIKWVRFIRKTLEEKKAERQVRQ
ncbi:MAG: hypothetical protein ACI4DU_06180 [Lachnospiraceae bacterium]